jgi:transposase InsO family protein
VSHRRAKLTPAGRLLLVQRVLELNWSPAAAADGMGVSRATVYKWIRRYLDEGPNGLEDRSSRPKRSPNALSARQVTRILKTRRRDKTGPHQLGPKLGHPRSTVYGVLRRHRVSRLRDTDRTTGVPIRRYCREKPGELLHVDVKKLGRIPPGGGHRMLGRQIGRGDKRVRIGHDFIHSAVDDCSRVAYSEILSDERGPTCAGFLLRAATFFADLGVAVERVMTDEAMNYRRSKEFRDALFTIGARHIRTGPYNPKLNGKVERFHLTLKWEWAYKRLYRSNDARRRAFPRWLDHYNQRRPHTALEGYHRCRCLSARSAGTTASVYVERGNRRLTPARGARPASSD